MWRHLDFKQVIFLYLEQERCENRPLRYSHINIKCWRWDITEFHILSSAIQYIIYIYIFKIIIHIVSSISIGVSFYNNEWWMIKTMFKFVNIACSLLASKCIQWISNTEYRTSAIYMCTSRTTDMRKIPGWVRKMTTSQCACPDIGRMNGPENEHQCEMV